MTETAPAIPRLGVAARASDPLAFTSLRTSAIGFAQSASGKTWTDYNLHDPGLTLLEAFCFALTEIGYRLDFAVPDHLCDIKGEVDGPQHGLFAADRIFPSSAVTADDVRRVVLDRVRHVQEIRVVPSADGSPDGLHHFLVLADQYHAAEHMAAHDQWVQRSTARAIRANRALGEDASDKVKSVAVRRCHLILDAELTGTRDTDDVLAEVFVACETLLMPPPQIADLGAQKAAGMALEQLYTGPLTRSGLIGVGDGIGGSERRPAKRSVSASQLRDCILAVAGIAEVAAVGISISPVPDAKREDQMLKWDGQVLSWNPDVCAPALWVPLQGSLHAADHVRLRRRAALPAAFSAQISDDPAAIDIAAVAARYEDLCASRFQAAPRGFAANPVPERLAGGRHLGPAPYASVADLLPPLYGLGLDRGAGGRPGALPSQFAAYIALLDQLLAGSNQLVGHLADLFSSNVRDDLGQLLPSYWPERPGNAQIPGIEQLYAAPGTAHAAALREAPDPFASRRQHILDFLLSLYGEHLDQASFGIFLDYLDNSEREAALLDNKAAYLAQIDVLTRDRGSGWNYGKRLWGPRAASLTTGFQRRIALLLGFACCTARRITSAADEAAAALPTVSAAPGTAQTVWPDSGLAAPSLAAGNGPVFADHALPQLLAAGVDRRNYRWHDHRLRLKLPGSSDDIDLGVYEDAHAAGRAAAALRSVLLTQTAAAETVHVIEHVLLRERGDEAAACVLPLRLTLVLPRWSARTSRADFRAFADEVIRQQCPAHLAVRSLWLQPCEMHRFEDATAEWMAALRRHVIIGGRRAAADPAALNAAARKLLTLLAPAWQER